MAKPVVHFEIIGPDPDALRRYYSDLFGWDAPVGAPVASEISDTDRYSFIDTMTTEDGVGITGGIGGGPGRASRVTVYVGVPDVEKALCEASRLGGRRVLGPVRNEKGEVTVGLFTDPAGNLIGVAGPG
jgi:predicted enzyme related to lactoylglutathione lyase